MADLTLKQRAFIASYARHGNGAQAAREAGYAPASANITAAKLLTSVNIQKELASIAVNFTEKVRKNAVNQASEVVNKLLDHVSQRLETPPDGDMTWRDSVSAGKLAADIAKLTQHDKVNINNAPAFIINIDCGRTGPEDFD